MWYLGWVLGAVLRWILGLWLAFWCGVLGVLSYRSMKADGSVQPSRESGIRGSGGDYRTHGH